MTARSHTRTKRKARAKMRAAFARLNARKATAESRAYRPHNGGTA